MELKLEHITKRYKDKIAVDDVSLTLTPGVWGMLGANGAGKTTLMRMIAGIMKPTAGEILYDNISIQSLGGEYRNIFGYLPQEFGFYPEFTVLNYLEYVAALKGLPKKEAKDKIGELLEQLTLSDVRKKKIVKLSGGMKRRVGIAQALVGDPQILVVDEPTAGLDPEERVRFRSVLSRFAKDGKTVLLSTHIVEDVYQICEELAVLRKGQLFYTGPSAALMARVDGKIKTVRLEREEELMELQKKAVVLSTTYESHGLLARIMDENGIFPQIAPVPATLEDAYVYCMGGKTHA